MASWINYSLLTLCSLALVASIPVTEEQVPIVAPQVFSNDAVRNIPDEANQIVGAPSELVEETVPAGEDLEPAASRHYGYGGRGFGGGFYGGRGYGGYGYGGGWGGGYRGGYGGGWRRGGFVGYGIGFGGYQGGWGHRGYGGSYWG